MRTKHIFYSMALVAALAACTQEEFNTPVDTNNQNLAVRPLLGDIQLTTDNAQTRFALGEGDAAQPVFADGDKLGAAIMDMPLYDMATGSTYAEKLELADGDAKALYQITEYYSSNNCFTMSNGIWTVDQPMVEGNYLFYAPYSNKMQARTPLSIKLPVKQDASESKAALDEFYKSGSVVRVGYQFLAANNGEAQKPNVNMVDVFAYPLFKITNDFDGYLANAGATNLASYSGAITLDSLQISQVVTATNNVNEVVCGGVLKHAGTSQTALTANDGVVSTLDGKVIAGDNGADWMLTPMENYTSQLLDDNYVTKNEVITTLDFGGKELERGASYSFYGVLPAMVYTDASNSMRVTLYVTIGEKQYLIEQAVKASGNNTVAGLSDRKDGILLTSSVDQITLIKGQKYPQEELNFRNNKLEPKPSKGDILSISLANVNATNVKVAKEISKAQTKLIKNNEEFINFFAEQLNGSALVETSGMEEIDPTKPSYEIDEENTVTINAELIDALFTYNNKGTLKINTAVPIADDVTITEVSGTNATFELADGRSYVIELGTDYEIATAAINVAADTEKTVIVNTSVTGLTNAGTIKTLYVTENGDLTISAAVGESVDAIINDGTLAVNGNLTSEAFVNNGKLSVSATVTGGIENNGVINVTNAAAIFDVIAGEGTVNLPKANAAAAFTVNPEQTVVYQIAADFTKEDLTAAKNLGYINAVSGNALTIVGGESDTEIILFDLKNFATVSVAGNITSRVNGALDLNGLTLEVTATASWTGMSVALTTVNNANIVLGDNVTLTLTNINANGTVTKGENAKLVANGTTSLWNGAASDND